MSDTLKIFGTTYTGVTAAKFSDGNSNILVYTRDGGGGGGGGDATLITKSITANGTYDAEDDSADGYSSVTVTVPTGTARTSSDLTASGDTVTVPAGLYAEAATKSVASGSAATPATTISVTPGISVSSSGLITATASGTQSVTPTVSAGYVSAGTAGTITVSGSNTSQLSTQAAATITPTESSQTAVAAGKYTTGAVTVDAISSTYVGSGVTTKAAATYNTSTSDQTIAASQYLSGAQTIKAVAVDGLSAGNVKYGATVKVGDSNDDDRIAGVTGTFSGSSTVSSGQTAATANKIVSGYSAFVDGAEVKGSIASKTNLTASTAAGVHTVTAEAGYYASNANRVYPTLQAKTWYPTTSSQTFPPNDGSTYVVNGTQTIAAVATSNLTAANIKAGVTVKVGDSADDDRIAGVTGTFTSDGTAEAGDIVSGKSAYVNGSKINGNLTFSTITVSSSNPSGGNNGDIWIKTS